MRTPTLLKFSSIEVLWYLYALTLKPTDVTRMFERSVRGQHIEINPH